MCSAHLKTCVRSDLCKRFIRNGHSGSLHLGVAVTGKLPKGIFYAVLAFHKVAHAVKLDSEF